MIAVHFENLLFLLFVAVAMLFQLLARAASKTRKDSDQQKRRSTSVPPRIPQPQAETDEERVRKFLEALGRPETSTPPPPVRPRPTYQKPIVLPHVPPFASPLPPLTTRPPDLPRKIRLPGQRAPTRPKKILKPRAAETPAFEIHESLTPIDLPPIIKTPVEAYAIATRATLKPEQTETNIPALLRSTAGLRSAIILREVFGPPRSLQPLDLVGSV